MIMLAKVVPYGGNSARYALEKEKAKMVKVNNMPEGLDATSIWYMMKHHCQLNQQERTVGRKLERFMVTFVISPTKEESSNFTMDDWAALQDEALDALDSVELIPKGMKEMVKTNFRNSMNAGGLHYDSKSGILHLHVDICRVDMDGNTNDVHDIHERASKAAEIINMRRGWVQPKDIREARRAKTADLCERILRNMQKFDTNRYFYALIQQGYHVKLRHDSNQRLVGYTLSMNGSVFKASEIGRKFTASKLEDTWRKFHPAPTQVKMKPVSSSLISPSRQSRPVGQSATFTQPRVQPKVQSRPLPSFSVFDIKVGDVFKHVQIPNAVKDIFFNEAEVPEGNDVATKENVAHVGMLFFAGDVDAATALSASCGGGGGGSSSGWGKKKDDEDDWKYARRCLQMAHTMCKPKPRTRSFHR